MMDRERQSAETPDGLYGGTRRDQAPDVVRLFPLPDHVFLPGFPSPYRVFEQRYRALVEDLMKLPEHEQWIAIPRLYRSRADAAAPPPFARLAAVGRVLHIHPLPNLQYLLVVGEAHRVRLEEVASDAPYRQARVIDRPRAVESGLEEEQQIQVSFDRVLQTVTRMAPSWGEARDTVIKALKAAPTLEDRVDLLGSLFVHSVEERQSLLEATRLSDRLDLIEDVLLRGEDSPLLSGFADDGSGAQA
jgi:Lon protease-like protein